MDAGWPQTISWGEFATAEPELAKYGADRLTAAPAYLATIRRSGAPRVRPVTPIFTDSGLFLYMEPTSPKGRDLRERGWFGLHNGVPDNAGTGGEFNVEGIGLAVDDAERWSHVADASSYKPLDRYILFEFQLSEARCHGYGDVPLPSTRKWSVGQSMSTSPRSNDVRTIDRDELWGMLARGDEFRLVMALNEWAFRAKHIPGSEHFNTPEEIFSSLNADDEIVVYCTSPDCHASVALYWALLDAGFNNVRRYSGGLTDWEDGGSHWRESGYEGRLLVRLGPG